MKHVALAVLIGAVAGCGPAPTQSRDGGNDGPADEIPSATPEDPVGERDPDPDVADDPSPIDEPEPVLEPELPMPEAPGAYSEGSCPILEEGVNFFDSAGHERELQVFFPAQAVEAPPLLFVWHALGSNATQFSAAFQAAKVADEYGAVVVVPESCCNPQAEWEPTVDSVLFDDVIACLEETRGIDRRRIYTTGFSAGGLWSTWLTVNRAQRLTAAVIFSGGVAAWLPYSTPAYPLPVVLVDGGPNDLYGGFVNFDTMTQALADSLVDDGHLVIQCDHGGGHTLPPGAQAWGYPFLFSHSWGDGSSPFAAGLDDLWPDYCELRLPAAQLPEELE